MKHLSVKVDANGTTDEVEVQKALTADNAENATNAINADAATYASNAANDSEGNYIAGYYAPKQTDSGGFAAGANVTAPATAAIAIGSGASGNGVRSVAIGADTTAQTVSIAIGSAAQGTGNSSIALGSGATVSANYAAQIGTGTNSTAHSLQFEDVPIVVNGKLNANMQFTQETGTNVDDVKDASVRRIYTPAGTMPTGATEYVVLYTTCQNDTSGTQYGSQILLNESNQRLWSRRLFQNVWSGWSEYASTNMGNTTAKPTLIGATGWMDFYRSGNIVICTFECTMTNTAAKWTDLKIADFPSGFETKLGLIIGSMYYNYNSGANAGIVKVSTDGIFVNGGFNAISINSTVQGSIVYMA